MKASISNSLSARCTSACPLRHTCTREENTGSDERKTNTRLSSEKESVFPPKQRRIERKSTTFLIHLVHPKFPPFSFDKTLLIRKKTFIFALDKTQPSLLLAALRCPHSANRRAFPDETTQTIFGLLKNCRCSSERPLRVHLAASNRHTVSQSVQHRLSPFISTTLCAKCSKRNSYFCPKQNIRIPTLCRQPALEFQARAAHNAEGGFRHTTTA